jgi:hypothetical protein
MPWRRAPPASFTASGIEPSRVSGLLQIAHRFTPPSPWGEGARRHAATGAGSPSFWKALPVDGTSTDYLKSDCDYAHLNPVPATRVLSPPLSPLNEFFLLSFCPAMILSSALARSEGPTHSRPEHHEPILKPGADNSGLLVRHRTASVAPYIVETSVANRDHRQTKPATNKHDNTAHIPPAPGTRSALAPQERGSAKILLTLLTVTNTYYP